LHSLHNTAQHLADIPGKRAGIQTNSCSTAKPQWPSAKQLRTLIRKLQREGKTSTHQIMHALNDQGIPAANGGPWPPKP